MSVHRPLQTVDVLEEARAEYVALAQTNAGLADVLLATVDEIDHETVHRVEDRCNREQHTEGEGS